MIAPALLVAVALSQSVNWGVGARLETRVRNGYAGLDTNDVIAADLGVGLDGSLGLSTGGWNFALSYDPTFRLREPYAIAQQGVRYDYTNRLTASGDWRREGSPHPYVRYSFSSGILDLSSMQTPGPQSSGGPGGTPTGPNPPTGPSGNPTGPNAGPNVPNVPSTASRGFNVINVIGSDVSGGIDWPLSPLTTLTTEGGYFWGGGSDFRSAVTLPVQSSPRGSVRLMTQLSPNDRLQFSLDARYSLFGMWFGPYDYFLRQRVALGTLQGLWTHQLDVHTSFTVDAGGAFAWGMLPDSTRGPGTTTMQPLGTGGGSFNHQFTFGHDTLLDLSLQASVGPYIDPYIGTAYERFESSGGIGYQSGRHLNAWARTGFTRSLVGGAYDIRSTYEDAGVGWQGDPWWRVDLSGRLAWFYQGTGPVPAGMPMTGGSLTSGRGAESTNWVIGLSLTLTQRSE